MNSRIRYCIFVAMGSLTIPVAQAAVADTPWSMRLFGGGVVAENGSLPAARNPTPLEAELETRHPASDRRGFPVSLGAVYHCG
jgi:hypothetical protein